MSSRLKHVEYVGGKESSEHAIWRGMIARCHNPNSKDYAAYGAKGVRVCKKWKRFEAFLLDMGRRPSLAHSVERVDAFKNYTPRNCVWATHSAQQRNKRSTRLYKLGAFTGSLTEAAARIGISKELAHWRFKAWGTFEKGVAWRELQKRR